MAFADRLKQLRKRKYSQEELAELLNVSVITISRWENGVMEPTAKNVSKLARLLETTAAYLLGDTDDPAPGQTAPTTEQDKEPLGYKKSETVNQGMVIFTDTNGARYEVPATPEGYAFLKEISDRDARANASTGKEEV